MDTPESTTRYCKRCDKTYPLTTEHWYFSQRQTGQKRVRCRVCQEGCDQRRAPKPVDWCCDIEGCERIGYLRGLCRRHHYRLKKHGDPLAGEAFRNTAPPEMCTIPGCDKPYVGKGLCGMHYQRRALHGDPLYQQSFAKYEPCQVRGCTALQRTKGFCVKHYSRFLKYGDPSVRHTAEPGIGTISVQGYRIVTRPLHPNANKHGKLSEHRLIMSEMLGRALLPGETVHHKNGNRLDNRPENLELWVKNHGSGQRAVDMVAWARAIIARYASLESNPYFANPSQGHKRGIRHDVSQLQLEGIA